MVVIYVVSHLSVAQSTWLSDVTTCILVSGVNSTALMQQATGLVPWQPEPFLYRIPVTHYAPC